jgi:hypothetical protein
VTFRSFVVKFKPPLTNEQVDAIVAEHQRLLEEAQQQPTETEEE